MSVVISHFFVFSVEPTYLFFQSLKGDQEQRWRNWHPYPQTKPPGCKQRPDMALSLKQKYFLSICEKGEGVSGTSSWLQFINVESKGAVNRSDPCSMEWRRRKFLSWAKPSSAAGPHIFPSSSYPRTRLVQYESGSGNGSGGQACNLPARQRLCHLCCHTASPWHSGCSYVNLCGSPLQ